MIRSRKSRKSLSHGLHRSMPSKRISMLQAASVMHCQRKLSSWNFSWSEERLTTLQSEYKCKVMLKFSIKAVYRIIHIRLTAKLNYEPRRVNYRSESRRPKRSWRWDHFSNITSNSDLVKSCTRKCPGVVRESCKVEEAKASQSENRSRNNVLGFSHQAEGRLRDSM